MIRSLLISGLVFASWLAGAAEKKVEYATLTKSLDDVRRALGQFKLGEDGKPARPHQKVPLAKDEVVRLLEKRASKVNPDQVVDFWGELAAASVMKVSYDFVPGSLAENLGAKEAAEIQDIITYKALSELQNIKTLPAYFYLALIGYPYRKLDSEAPIPVTSKMAREMLAQASERTGLDLRDLRRLAGGRYKFKRKDCIGNLE